MDIWSFAAAAGAGLAQHWTGLTRGGQSISESSCESSNKIQPESSPLVEQPLDQKGPFRRLVQRKNLSGNVSKERESVPLGVLTEEVASTSEFLSNGDLQEDCEGVRVSGYGDLLLKPLNVQHGSPYCSMRNRRNARSKRINGRFVKPLNSLESCLMAKLYKENAEMEEYAFDKVPSLSMPIVRPLLVTDGSRIISRASGDFFSVHAQNGDNKMQNENYLEENKTIFGIPPLPKVGSLGIPRKTKETTRKERGGRISNMSKMVGGKHSHSQGSSSGALLFCLGVSVGVISSFLANNREVDKLNELLKQTENLVQDLQEELEMKDSLTVKELPIEDYESQDTHGNPCSIDAPQAFSLVQSLDESIKSDRKEIDDRKEEEESLSKIEAELEAELEMLELSMNSSSLEHKLSDLVELDLDLAPDIVHGELRADMFGTQTGAQPYADRDGSGSSTTHSANYAVSPRELSLRLHEVLQSRLEERVIELETALQNSNRKVQYMKSDHSNKPRREFSNRDWTAPSVQESLDKEEENFSDEPVVINLSGEALDAYNEAYDEFANMNESDNEDLEENQESLCTFEQYLNDHSISNGKASTTKGEDHEGYTGMSEDESGGDDDEMEKLLIKQILEKARKGSPVVLNAQRVLCLMEQDDQH